MHFKLRKVAESFFLIPTWPFFPTFPRLIWQPKLNHFKANFNLSPLYLSKVMAKSARGLFSKWPPPPSKKHEMKFYISTTRWATRGKRGVIFHYVWHSKSSDTIILQFWYLPGL